MCFLLLSCTVPCPPSVYNGNQIINSNLRLPDFNQITKKKKKKKTEKERREKKEAILSGYEGKE
jgi:hypothetical protein